MGPYSGNRHRQNRQHLLQRNGIRLIQKSRPIKHLEQIQVQNRRLDPDFRLNWGSFSTDVRWRQYPSSDTSWWRPCWWCPWRPRLWGPWWPPDDPARRAVRPSSCPDRPAPSWPRPGLEANLQPEDKGRPVSRARPRSSRPLADPQSVSSSRQAPAPIAPALPRPGASLFDPATYVSKSPTPSGRALQPPDVYYIRLIHQWCS